MPVIAEELRDNMHTCMHCGLTGVDVVYYGKLYVGGKGEVPSYYCLEQEACWKRWQEKQKGDTK